MRKTVEEIQLLARAVRRDVLDMTFYSGANGGHLGGALSCADILASLYGEIMDVDPLYPDNPCRDRFILSKGHVALAHYAVLAEEGFLAKEDILSFEKPGSKLQTHEVVDIKRGIEVSGGSLGYGVSIGVGCALSAKRRQEKYKTFVLMGDGECNEGSVWEAIMSAAKFKLDNLFIIIDINKQQLDGMMSDVMPINDFRKACEGFGCAVEEIDGHNIKEVLGIVEKTSFGRPLVILAHTVKGKGIASIEGRVGFHHVRLTSEQYELFRGELED